MKYNRKKQKKIYALIILLLVTIGYALLSTTLKINGIANIKSNTWDIHFENVQPNNNSTVTAEKPSITDNATKVSYEVTLELPGDYYEFTVDAVNDGSINGKITKVDHKVYESDGVTEATLPSYIKYSIVYDGTSTAPALGDILEAGESKTYRVRIEFDSEATTLPSADLTYVIVDEIKYTQTKDTNSNVPPAVQAKMNQIIANPDNFRDENQSSSNRDIGLDENGNVINLDMWVDNETDITSDTGKSYLLDNNEVVLTGSAYEWTEDSEEPDGGYYNYFDVMVPATSSANIVDGELQTSIPAYIMFAGTNKFYPVTKLEYIFGNSSSSEDAITVMPHLPSTVKIIGDATFLMLSMPDVTIPKNVKYIEKNAFFGGSVETLSFEEDSKLEIIGESSFENNSISGNLTLPQTVTTIEKKAFKGNSLTSVTFPSTAEYYRYPDNVDYDWYASFDDDVTISHQY